MRNLRKLFVVSLSLLAALSFAACDHSGSSQKTAGPASAASFAGVTMNINPTVVFTNAVEFTYLNDVVADSVFPVTGPDPIEGVFTYNPSSDYSSGTLTLSFLPENPGDDEPFDSMVIVLSNFIVVEENVTGATGSFNGGSYQVEFAGNLSQMVITDGGEEEDEFDVLPTHFFEANANIDLYYGFFTPVNPPDGFTYETGEEGLFTFDRHSRLYTDRARFNPPIISSTNPDEYIFTSDSTDYVIVIRLHPSGRIAYIAAFSTDLTTEYGYFPG